MTLSSSPLKKPATSVAGPRRRDASLLIGRIRPVCSLFAPRPRRRLLVDSGTASSTAPEPEPAAEQDIEAGDDVWSALLFKLGFSFFVGFALGYAVRAFFKFTIVGIGMMLFMLFGLEYAGLIDVHWAAFEGRFDSITGWLQQQTGGFKAFITGQLPSAGTALAGLVIGWTRR